MAPNNGIPSWRIEKLEDKVQKLERLVGELILKLNSEIKVGDQVSVEEGFVTVTRVEINSIWASKVDWPCSKEYKSDEYQKAW